MLVITTVYPNPGNLAAIINTLSQFEGERCTRCNHGIQIEDGAVLPQYCVGLAVKDATNCRTTHHLSLRVNASGEAAYICSKGAKVGNFAYAVPDDRVEQG